MLCIMLSAIYADCRALFIVVLSVIMLSHVMLNVIMLTAIMLNDVAPLKCNVQYCDMTREACTIKKHYGFEMYAIYNELGRLYKQVCLSNPL